ncbi:MAG TPA: hypothetical protein VGE04_16500 [Chloroflexia bacterium]
MSYTRNPSVGVRPEAPPDMPETTGGGPLVAADPNAGSYNTTYAAPRRVPARFKLERFGFWVIAAAATLLLLVVLGFVLKPVIGGIITGAWLAAFVGMLTMLNLPRPSNWANTVLGRRVFPVIHANDGELWRMAGVNAGLTFVFGFAFEVVAFFLGGFLGGLVVFGGLVALGIFYNRARKVIINP